MNFKKFHPGLIVMIGLALLLSLACHSSGGKAVTPEKTGLIELERLDDYSGEYAMERQDTADNVRLEINATTLENTPGLAFELTYDPATYNPTSVTYGNLFGANTLRIESLGTPGIIPLSEHSTDGSLGTDGVFATVMLEKQPANMRTLNALKLPPSLPELTLDQVTYPGSVYATWETTNTGDYNGDTIVNSLDLFPLALLYGHRVPSNLPHSLEAWVDGNDDGELDGKDVFPIVANYKNSVTGYKLYKKDIFSSQAYEVAHRLERDNAIIDDGHENPSQQYRYEFLDTVYTPSASYVLQAYLHDPDTGDQTSDAGEEVFIESTVNGEIVSGYVYDDQGNPLPQVEISLDNDLITGFTDNDSFFYSIGVKQGNHVLSVIKSGYKIYDFEFYKEPNEPLHIEVRPDRERQISAVDDEGSVVGIFTDNDAELLSDVFTLIYDSDGFYAFGISDENGEVLFEEMPAGNYSIIGYGETFITEYDQVSVLPGEESEITLEMTETQTGTLYGQATDNRGGIVAGASIAYLTRLDTQGGEKGNNYLVFTDENGLFEIPNVQAAEGIILGRSSGYDAAFIPEVEVFAGQSTEQDVAFTFLGDLSNVNGLFTGHVINRLGQDVPTVSYTMANFRVPQTLISGDANESGAFGVTDLKPGTYRISLFKQGYARRTVFAKVEPGLNPEKEIVLYFLGDFPDNQPNPVIFGTVADFHDHTPISSAYVSLYEFGTGELIRDGWSNSSGEFLFSQLPQGPAELFVLAEGYQTHFSNLNLVDGLTTLDIDLLAEGSSIYGAMQGYVKDFSGNPISGVFIELSNGQNPGTDYEAYSDDSGYFQILDIMPSTWQVTVEKVGYDPLLENIEISAGQIVTRNYLMADSSSHGNMDGRVTNEEGMPLEGALVTVFDHDFPMEDLTNSKGRFLIESIPIGEHTYIVELEGYRPHVSDVMINSDKVTVDVVLIEE